VFFYLHEKFKKILTIIETIGAYPKSILSLEGTMGLWAIKKNTPSLFQNDCSL